MNEEKLIWGAGFIDDDIVSEAIDYKPRRIRLAPWACTAAAAVVLVTALAVFARRGGDPPVGPGPSSGGELPSYSTTKEPPTSSTTNEPPASSTTDEPPTSSNCEPPESTTSSSTSENSGNSSVSTVDIPVEPANPGISGDYPAYTDIFEEFVDENPGTYGPPPTCEEIMNFLEPIPDHPEYDVDSYYIIEVVRALSFEEYAQISGTDMSGGGTIYEVKLMEDLISGENPDRTEFIFIPAGEGARIQTKDDPTYAPGEKFTAVLTKPHEGYYFVRSVCDYALRYDLPEMSFTEDDTETMLYYRGKWMARRPITDLPFDTEEINITAAFSTPQNPATYIQKIALDDLAEFLREEWEKKGISSHFDG